MGRFEDWKNVDRGLQIIYLSLEFEEGLVATKKTVTKLNPMAAESPHPLACGRAGLAANSGNTDKLKRERFFSKIISFFLNIRTGASLLYSNHD